MTYKDGTSLSNILTRNTAKYKLEGDKMTKKEWYEDLSDKDIEWLKENKVCSPLLANDEVLKLTKIPLEDLEVYIFETRKWVEVLHIADAVGRLSVLRLRPDWQRPEKKKEGHWEYREVSKSGWGFWKFERSCADHSLYQAPGMVGFGGVEFEENTGAWYMDIARYDDGLVLSSFDNHESYKPATPHRVRFWVEGE